jgi:hypothetical protein
LTHQTKLFLWAFIQLISQVALALPKNDISQEFAANVKPDRSHAKRSGTPEAMVRFLKNRKLIASRTENRLDFSDYFTPLKDVTFFGLPVFLVQHEQRREGDVGCCENPGIGLFLETDGTRVIALEKFLHSNACTSDRIENIKADVPFRFNPPPKPNVTYVRIWCDEWTLRNVAEQQE